MRNDEIRRRRLKKNYKDYLINKCVYLYLKRRVDKFIFLTAFHSELKKNSSTLLRRYCVITGRSRGIFRHFRLSRHSLHLLMKNRLINGLRRISW